MALALLETITDTRTRYNERNDSRVLLLEAVLEPERPVALDDLAVDFDERVIPNFFRSGRLRQPLTQKLR
ncbi:hypothetical protein BB347_12630 [Natronorubrum daqingense]|uniref:Uncharacterized protein n=1 Tax=Natronorubrum daqingense TaxID=588898 RepID=A0A1P8RFI4_9EURY|nr:hypothetical protein BB347_12630 [Natronorubrum daqingense]